MGLGSAARPRSTRSGLHASEHPFFRRYGISLPSSLTRVRSSALACSACPPVSVCGTGGPWLPGTPFVPVQARAPCGASRDARSCSLLGLAAYQLERPSSGRAPCRPGSRRFNATVRCWNLHQLSIAYALRPRLRPDSPAADGPCSGTLGHSAVGVRTPLCVTHPDIRTRPQSSRACARPSPRGRRSPTTPPPRVGSRASVWRLSPSIVGAALLDQ